MLNKTELDEWRTSYPTLAMANRAKQEIDELRRRIAADALSGRLLATPEGVMNARLDVANLAFAERMWNVLFSEGSELDEFEPADHGEGVEQALKSPFDYEVGGVS